MRGSRGWMRYGQRLSIILLPLAATLASTSGCGFEVNYGLSAITGHLNLLCQSEPIESALDDPGLSDEQRRKLDLLIQARDYARDAVGLNVGRSYTRFVLLDDDVLAYNLSGSRADAVDPYVWKLPIVGPITYLGFFELDEATAERDRLVAEGFDTLIYEVDAYSTVGLLPDPATSAMLKRSDGLLVDTVFHELTHNTIWSGSDVVFDESLAMFVGQTAALEFLADTFGEDSTEVNDAVADYEDSARFNAFMAELRDELDMVYENDALSTAEKKEARKPIFESAQARFADEVLPAMNAPDRWENYTTFNFNNAFLLVNGRYNSNQDLFAAVHDATGGEWSATLAVFREAAAADRPFDALRAWVNDPQ